MGTASIASVLDIYQACQTELTDCEPVATCKTLLLVGGMNSMCFKHAIPDKFLVAASKTQQLGKLRKIIYPPLVYFRITS